MNTVGLPLKVFVVASGVLLVVGSMVLAVLVVLNLGVDRAPPPDDEAGAAIVGEPLPLPSGARIDQVVPDPAGGPLVLLGTDGEGAPFLALVDPARGTLVRLIRLAPGGVP